MHEYDNDKRKKMAKKVMNLCEIIAKEIKPPITI